MVRRMADPDRRTGEPFRTQFRAQPACAEMPTCAATKELEVEGERCSRRFSSTLA